jgi:hypothetical protein
MAHIQTQQEQIQRVAYKPAAHHRQRQGDENLPLAVKPENGVQQAQAVQGHCQRQRPAHKKLSQDQQSLSEAVVSGQWPVASGRLPRFGGWETCGLWYGWLAPCYLLTTDYRFWYSL